MEELVKKYRTISPLLRKIEEVVAGTNTGKSQQLTGYYAFWERVIFHALNGMVLAAMKSLVSMLNSRSSKRSPAEKLAKPPLFKVHFHICRLYKQGIETADTVLFFGQM